MSRFFSNGTEGRAWEALWCERCERDHGMHQPEQSDGCEFLLYALSGMDDQLDGVWFDETDKHGFTFPPAVRCGEFKPCEACGHGEIVLNADGYPPPVRQREFIVMGDRRIPVTDVILNPPAVSGSSVSDPNSKDA